LQESELPENIEITRRSPHAHGVPSNNDEVTKITSSPDNSSRVSGGEFEESEGAFLNIGGPAPPRRC